MQLIQTGGEGAEDSVGAFLIPFLQGGKLQIVGETTEEELETIRRLLPGWTVVPIDASDLIQECGALHCVSLNIPALNGAPDKAPNAFVPNPLAPLGRDGNGANVNAANGIAPPLRGPDLEQLLR